MGGAWMEGQTEGELEKRDNLRNETKARDVAQLVKSL